MSRTIRSWILDLTFRDRTLLVDDVFDALKDEGGIVMKLAHCEERGRKGKWRNQERALRESVHNIYTAKARAVLSARCRKSP